MDSFWQKCNVHYYLREKNYGNVRKIIQNATTTNSDNAVNLFYSGISYILEGQLQKGIIELTPLQSYKDTQLAVIIALVIGHKEASSSRDNLNSLEAKLKEERKHANAISFYYAGLFLSLAEKYEKASEYINKSLKKDPNNLDILVLKGWNDMYMNFGEMQISVLDCLELVLTKSDKNIEALLGLAKLKYLSRDYEGSNLILDKLVVSHPGVITPLVEKLKNDFAMQKWEAVYDTMERVLILDPGNIVALQIRIFITLCKNADYIEAADLLNNFYSVLENNETENGYQFFNTAKIFSKICSRSTTVLSQIYRFVQYASEMYPNNIEYLTEVGYQCVLQSKIKDAISFYKAASKINSNSIMALCGLTLCQITETGPTEQISEQVELLFEMQGTNKLPILYLLSAKLSYKNSPMAITFLNTASDLKIFNASQIPFGLDYVKCLDPDFLLEVYREYKKHLPPKPFVLIGFLLYTRETNNSVLEKCFEILSTISSACPAMIVTLYELANLKFLYGYVNEAQKLAETICELDNTHAGSQLLLAQIGIQQQDYAKASQNLEICMSYNFKIRDSAMYHFLKGVILKNTNQIQEALSSFMTSFGIVTNKSISGSANKQYESDLNIVDKATLYLQIIEIRTTLGQHAEAGKIMQEAIQEFSYTSEEGRLVIAKAEIELNKGDVDKAIEKLNEVKAGQPYYFQAHTRMAHIYLKEKNDRTMFTNCFKEVVSNHPMADAHTMMGDAYMSIHEPVLAVESYETALKENSANMHLIKKLGIALVKSHEFFKAMQHYENSIKKLEDDNLKFDYFELLIKLKQYDKADSELTDELNLPKNKEKDVAVLKRRVNFLLLQAKARDLKNPISGNTTLILTETKDLQSTIVKRVEIDSRGDLNEEKEKLSSILCSLARIRSLKEPAVAVNLYSEALINVPRKPSTLLALAKLYAQMNNPEKCEQTCSILLNADPNNEAAAVMMADLAFRKVDFEAAYRHLNQILTVKPMSWDALAQLVEVQWRRGDLSDAEQLLEAAKLAMDKEGHPGYYYCAGTYAIYSGNPNAALRQLNLCRRTERWGQAAARRMVLLCLSQDAPDALTDTFTHTQEEGDTKLLAIRTAEKLLAEVSPVDKKPLQALIQLTTKQKQQAERVLQELLPLTTEDTYQDDPFLILAIATAYNIIKQPTRAKNILKRTVSSIPWMPENADGLERCWLEVADSQVSAGRTDAARELLTKILEHNKSCATAYQYLGYLAEKEQNYKTAVQHYDNAWNYSGKNNLAFGYKLAHAYLKLKKYPECIVVCRHILKIHPEYPKIKKEIFEKAKINLRT